MFVWWLLRRWWLLLLQLLRLTVLSLLVVLVLRWSNVRREVGHGNAKRGSCVDRSACRTNSATRSSNGEGWRLSGGSRARVRVRVRVRWRGDASEVG